MVVLEVGRICIKTAGREAGKYCTVLKKIDDAFVSVTGPKLLTGVKRRKCNVSHLEATQYAIEIKEEASDEEVMQAMDKAGLIKKLDLKKPSAAEMKAEKAKPKEERPKEEKPKEKETKKKEKKK